MDQGSVVVLCRRVFLSAEIPNHPVLDRDLNYSGSIPTATTSDPRSHYVPSLALVHFTQDFFAWDQGSVLIGVGFIACNLPYFATTRSCPN